jgi:hypothetical protein
MFKKAALGASIILARVFAGQHTQARHSSRLIWSAPASSPLPARLFHS